MDDKLIQYVSDPTPDAASLSILDQAIKTFCTVTPYKILFHYLTHDAVQYSPPYRWEDTRRTISLDDRVPFSAFKGLLETALISAVHHNRDVIATASEAGIWIDTILQTLCDYWRPDEPVPIPDSIIYYLNNRNSKDTLAQLLLVNDFGARLWSSFPITLSPQHSPPQVQRLPFNVGLDEVVQAMWCLAWSGSDTYSATVYEPVLEALEATCKFSPLTFSVTTMIKSRLVNSLLSPYEPLGGPALQHSLLPTETAIPIPPEFLDAKITDNLPDFERVLGNRIGEAKIVLVAEFLEGIRFDFIPYKAIETLHHICATVPEADIHPTHQIRFANAMHHIKMLAMDDRGPGKKLMDSIIESKIFEAYFEAGQPRRHQNAQPGHAWLQDSSARLEVIGILGNYMCSPAIAPRNQAIFTGLRLDSLHPN
jgi:hypothetical protein